ncbi:hypothetical protein ACFWFQ_00810, partial [Nocardia salmonicida]|uniref:hypothetical protein n=1 Tax=Nocardia salmonicida TaxID=53431 RepID=UPI003647BE0A
GNNVRLLEQSAAEVRYYRSGLNMDNSLGADPLMWLGDVRLGAAAPETEVPETAGSAMTSGLPRGYRGGRKALYAMTIAASVCAALALLAGGVIGGLQGGLGSANAVLEMVAGDTTSSTSRESPLVGVGRSCDLTTESEC